MTNRTSRPGDATVARVLLSSAILLIGLASCASPVDIQSPHTMELRALYEEDQAIRADGFQGFTPEQIKAVVAEDEVRKARVYELVEQDALALPEDCYRAAMVLQHGGEPIDYLMAHVLASAAAQDGHEGARWLSAASLDRYLMAIKQPQVFRTQFNSMNGSPWTQEPVVDLLGDSLRDRFGVPSLADSKASLAGMNAE